jgi:hypothetical protein
VKPWRNQALIAVLIIVVFPLGLFLMWRFAPWRLEFKWLWTVLVLLFWFVLVFVRPPSDAPSLEESSTLQRQEVPLA